MDIMSFWGWHPYVSQTLHGLEELLNIRTSIYTHKLVPKLYDKYYN